MPPAAPRGWQLYLPGEEWVPNHHLAPIIQGLVAYFRSEGRALLRTVSR
jgi:hypothetical protein